MLYHIRFFSALMVMLLLLSNCYYTKNSNQIKRVRLNQAKSDCFINRLTADPEYKLIDTIHMHDKIAIQENRILSKPIAESIYLVYRDSVVVFDPENYTEYIKIMDRKIPLKLIK